MSDEPQRPDVPEIPRAMPARGSRWPPQLIWLIPLAAVVIGGWLAVTTILERGPTITITFKTAEGIAPGKTRIKYKDVDVGIVKSVTVAEDLKTAIVSAELAKAAEKHLVDDTRFWVVHARISGSGVSGLATLLSGSYIAVDVGHAAAKRRSFAGLENPPAIVADVPGRQFTLHAQNLGSLAIGSPVYFRRLQVGQVAAYDLDADGSGVSVKIFINSPFDRYVNSVTRFWHASGIDLSLDAGGVRVTTESLVSLLIGGLAFETPAQSASTAPAPAGTEFILFPTREEAARNPDRLVENYILVFRESVRGLAVGAPVDFRGIVIGEVASINVDYDPVKADIVIPVEIRLYPDRLSSRYRERPAQSRNSRDLLDKMVERGFRAQLRTGNLLTGQIYIALDLFPEAAKAKLDWTKRPLELPTVPGSLQELQTSMASIARKLDRVPFDTLGANLDETLRNAGSLLKRIDTEVAPELHATLENARRTLSSAERVLSPDTPLQVDAREAMREIARAAQAFRILADYLERHPEALISGKKEDPK